MSLCYTRTAMTEQTRNCHFPTVSIGGEQYFNMAVSRLLFIPIPTLSQTDPTSKCKVKEAFFQRRGKPQSSLTAPTLSDLLTFRLLQTQPQSVK